MTKIQTKLDENEPDVRETVEIERQRALKAVEIATRDALKEKEAPAAQIIFIRRMRRYIGI